MIRTHAPAQLILLSPIIIPMGALKVVAQWEPPMSPRHYIDICQPQNLNRILNR
jgi:hypothetical protein